MIGETIGGKYQVLELIGSGGMARVYKAEHLVIGKEVALKIIKPHLLEEAPDFGRRFLDEARVSFQLKHHNIATLYDAGEENGLLYMVMEFIRGETLKEIISRRGQLPVREAEDIVKNIASALDYIHAQGFIHRDVKSGNIMIRQSDNAPMLMDFGIARAATGTRLTQTGFQMGTPEYMSPEQADGRPATKASDIYALGIVAYEMLTGRVPFSADTPTVTLLHHLTKSAMPVNALRPDLPLGAGNAVMRALSKDPGERYATAGDFARALEIGESSPPPPSAETRIVTPVGRETPQVAQAPLKQTGEWLREDGYVEREKPVTAQASWRPRSATVQKKKETATSIVPAPSLGSKHKPVLLFAVLLGAVGIMVIFIALGISLGWFGNKPPSKMSGTDRTSGAGQAKSSEPAAPEGMAFIPAGEFWMGCSPGDNECNDDEKPRVNVYIDGFYIDKHEVTQGEYARVMGSNPSYFSNCGDDCPVETVSWDEAKSYCEKMGKRLPTEAEWEKAARGGTETRYYWGMSMRGKFADIQTVRAGGGHSYGGSHSSSSEIGDYAWFSDNSGGTTHPVGQKKPNGYGLYDTAGNVWEWVEDCYDSGWYGRLSNGQRNPMYKCTVSGGLRVVRGGSWGDVPGDLRVAGRDGGGPVDRGGSFGFRCSQD